MLKRNIFIGFVLTLLFTCGCGENKYNDIIDKSISFNHEICKKYYNDSGKVEKSRLWFEREKSDFIIWEDENNYYVLMQRNFESEGENITHADGYKVGKENGKVTTAPDDRTMVVEYWQNNEKPLYEEKNVNVQTDSISSDMR